MDTLTCQNHVTWLISALTCQSGWLVNAVIFQLHVVDPRKGLTTTAGLLQIQKGRDGGRGRGGVEGAALLARMILILCDFDLNEEY